MFIKTVKKLKELKDKKIEIENFSIDQQLKEYNKQRKLDLDTLLLYINLIYEDTYMFLKLLVKVQNKKEKRKKERKKERNN